MTTSRSAVSDISLIRWLRDEHGPPFGGQVAQEVAGPADPLGVEAVDGLVEEKHAGVAEQCGGDPESLAHAERVLAGALAGHLGQADDVEHLVDPAWGMSLDRARKRRWS